MEESLGDVEPRPFRDRLYSKISGISLTPGVLTMKTAHTIDPSLDSAATAHRGAGVQLSFEGLRLTRSIIQEQPWDELDDPEPYYLDLLAANVLVSRGFYHLTGTGVAEQSIEIIQRFARNQTYVQQSTPELLEAPLEIDIIKLAVNAGADMAMQSIPTAVSSYGDTLAHELEQDPLPQPEDALGGVEEQITGLVDG